MVRQKRGKPVLTVMMATEDFYDEAKTRPDLPPVATGGRYDALTRRLGGGQDHPAVGAVIRPELALATQEGRS